MPTRLEKSPVHDIASWPKYEIASPPEALVETAEHELHHALVAMAMNAKVVSVSVERRGNILGVTSYAGTLNPDQMKMIAVAGSIVDTNGHASGYGSDLQKANYLQYQAGGLSVEQAKTLAEKVVNAYPPDVRKKAAQMIAVRKNVTGSQLKIILNTARMEVALEKEMVTLPPDWEANIIDEREEEIPNRTIVGYEGENKYAYNYLKNSFSNN